MKRRDFFRNGALTTLGLGAFSAIPGFANGKKDDKIAKNIIFLVSDGMSSGTLNMADLLIRQKEGQSSNWIRLYQDNTLRRSLMDTASANSFVTDSAAAGSAWGGGVRVNNGVLNIAPNGEKPVPVLQKFKSDGKSVGCVTTVQITHATPASFCVNSSTRNAQPSIAEEYLKLRFDVMMGGGEEFFKAETRVDKRDLFGEYKDAGFEVVRNKKQMSMATGDKPLLGIFSEDGLPYAIDRENDPKLNKMIPSLAHMTKKAIELLQNNDKGFVLQVEGGKVDWAAHGNDSAALLYDQLDFDKAIGEAMDFAMQDGETLVIVTTDHGNSNPGLFSGSQANNNFGRLHTTTASNEWVLSRISGENTVAQIVDLIMEYQKIPLKTEEAAVLLQNYQLGGDGLYNPQNHPFHVLSAMQSAHTSIQWAGTNHSGDYVELAMFGPGSENLPGFIENYKLHQFMLEAAQVDVSQFV